MLVSILGYLRSRSQARREAHRKGHIQLILRKEQKQHWPTQEMHLIQAGLERQYTKSTRVWVHQRDNKKISKPRGMPCGEYYSEYEGNWCYTFDEDEPAIEELE